MTRLFLSCLLCGCALDWTAPELDDAEAGDVVAAAACLGRQVGGACWFLGAAGESCDQVCTGRGEYDEATSSYAGSSGTTDNCAAVLDALELPGGSAALAGAAPGHGAGCMFDTSISARYWLASPATTAEASFTIWRRACACGGR